MERGDLLHLDNDPMNKMIEYPFVPFRGRTEEEYVLRTDEGRVERKDYAFWIRILASFLNSPSLVEYDSDRERTVQLTAFGNHMFPYFMKTFAELYRQNDALRKAVVDYQITKDLERKPEALERGRT